MRGFGVNLVRGQKVEDKGIHMKSRTIKEMYTSELFATRPSLKDAYHELCGSLESYQLINLHIFLNTLFVALDKEKLND